MSLTVVTKSREPITSIAPRGDHAKLLAVFLDLPQSLEKSAHMLVMKYACEHGWQPTVLTVTASRQDRPAEESWHGIRIVRLAPRAVVWRALQPFYAIRRRLPRRSSEVVDRPRRPINALLSFPDHLVHARTELVQHAAWLHKRERFHTVISLYYPLTSHLVANELAGRQGIPWVAMTKDFYSWPDELLGSIAECCANWVKRRYERRVLRRAVAVASVNENITEYLRTLLPQTPVHTLAHCYDPADFVHDPEAVSCTFCRNGPEGAAHKRYPTPSPGDVFRLVSLGKADRSEERGLRCFFDAVGDLLKRGEVDPERFRLRFVGFGEDIVNACARRAGCAAIVETVAQVPHAQAIQEMQSAVCLWFQQAEWGNRRRLAEYFAARRPILAFPDCPGLMSQTLLRRHGAARIASDKDTLQATILDWYREFLATGTIRIAADDEFVESFSARRRAQELDAMLREVMSSGEIRAESGEQGKDSRGLKIQGSAIQG